MFNLPYLPSNNDSFGLQMAGLHHPDVVSLVANLQNTIMKQQLLINRLLAKATPQDMKVEDANGQSASHIKVENDHSPAPSQGDNSLGDYYCTETLQDSPYKNKITNGIIRRNGFKQATYLTNPKVEVKQEDAGSLLKADTFKEIEVAINVKVEERQEVEEDEDEDDEKEEEEEESEDSYSTQPEPVEEKKKKKKSTRKSKKPKNLSKAKHLWVNYGRRILEYAAGKTGGYMQDRLKYLAGKLNSKKDFERTFQTKPTDSKEDREFKIVLGNIAIDFVRSKAATTFENSKYKNEMITQRHTVSAWIERLINC